MPYLMLTDEDTELLGASSSIDGMGVLAIWSERGRDLVPYLTEQTTEIQGFQILVEAFRLWEEFLKTADNSKYSEKLSDFFILVEQAFARTVGSQHKDWNLPGANRVGARLGDKPRISLDDLDWHLLGAQKSTGLWGLYRGASRRAGLLTEDMKILSPDTYAAAKEGTLISPMGQKRLLDLVGQALAGDSPELPTNLGNSLVQDLCNTYDRVPLRAHFQQKLIDNHVLNRLLAERLRGEAGWDRRQILTSAALDFQNHKEALENAIRCENLLSVVLGVFDWLRSSNGKKVELAGEELQKLNLGQLSLAIENFSASGHYEGGTSKTRHEWFVATLDTTSHVALARSVLELHKKVSEARNRSTWVWEENECLRCDVPIENFDPERLVLGKSWTNDYYLYPLKCIADELAGGAS